MFKGSVFHPNEHTTLQPLCFWDNEDRICTNPASVRSAPGAGTSSRGQLGRCRPIRLQRSTCCINDPIDRSRCRHDVDLAGIVATK